MKKVITKKRIAKEIIYFFSVIAFLLLVWSVIEIRNFYLKNKIDNFSQQILNLNIQIDSIEQTYPKKAKTFYELIEKDSFKPDDNLAKDTFDFTDIVENKYQLYTYLIENKFDWKNFNVENGSSGAVHFLLPNDAVLSYESFEESIREEFNKKKKSNIETIYNYIKSKNRKFNYGIDNLVLCLKGLPEPPSLEDSNRVAELEKMVRNSNQKEIQIKKKLLFSSEINNIIIWCAVIILVLLYPFRAIFFTLKWAFRTVRQKE